METGKHVNELSTLFCRMRKIVFITSTLSQPRIIKRINTIYNAGFDVKVYGFDRNVYNCNSLPNVLKPIKLGDLKDGKGYLDKIKKFRKAIDYIVAKEGKDDVIFYSFSLISSFFLKKKKVRYVYELSDLLYGYKRFNAIRPILKYLEQGIIRKSHFTVMTSEGFRNYLFGDNGPKNIIIQPNKLNGYFKEKKRPEVQLPDINRLRFGFVGAVRYKETVLRFAKIIGKEFPMHEFHFFGESIIVKSFQEETKEFPNVFYHGQFRNPEDLFAIYNALDIIVACYETESLNERIAEPNKLYESIYFGKPIIVSNHSFLEKKVDNWHCGYSINAYSDEAIRDLIRGISLAAINGIIANTQKIKEDSLIDNPEKIIEILEN